MLTKRQKEILDFVENYSQKKGYAPSFEEIKKHLKLASVSTVHFHIKKLQESGWLKKQENTARTISVSEKEPLVKILLLGIISAGQPIEAIEDKETIVVPKNKLPKGGNVYALRVQGDSMIDENIHDGDTILIKKQNTAENGDKVVALLNGNEATLKTFYKEKGQIRLQPANKNYQPTILKRGEEISVQGVLFDVMKTSEAEQLAEVFILPSKKDTQQRGKISNYLNNIYNGDIMHVLKDLPDNSVDMVFGDPDYNVGIKYGSNNYTRDFDDYINWYIELTKESMRVLKNDGNFFTLNYPRQNAHLRVKYLDSQFPHINEYVWVYNTNVGHTPKRFTTAHRSILHVRKSAKNKFFKDAVALPYKNPTDKRIRQNLANGSKGRMPYSWFEFNLVKNVSKEKTYHACQIPQKLTEMLIKSSTKPNDIVLVLFGGSGAEIALCKNLNRKFISAEIDKKYCTLISNRLSNGFIAPEHKLFRGRKRIET
ncbi:transcriptional repressor LexA [Patescibacteria group bacterium]|nr:transcriptional repressor LexA [Patescibacteria group bacterium]MCG2694754.1 transcriptional repressor LexA [Candidatus Parcubacteria bacterium]